ncbi:MAG: serine/threonine-protein kinase [Myxococcaceae bacterium]|nr:serine/threonine-protein kinase [Myxococcaceae bacterium]
MTPERSRQVVALFEEACALPMEERSAYLGARAGGDVELQRAVEAMLSQDERRSLLRTAEGAGPGLVALDALGPPGAERMPERVGEYRILGVMGAGAMGTVYRAEQSQPRREVALKTIHWWVLSPAAVERFRFEAQALAQLQHPGIPQVYEVVEDVGHISFAMELVEGPSLSEYVAGLRGDVRRVLGLLAQVADAVHHAHLRGLVHRDLKPDNIRVTASGQPKVLDFGISLPLQASGAPTRVGEVSGTLAYMAPEQLWPEGGLDIRADVYALGVIAYELLCGVRPFHLSGLSFEAARAHVRDARVVPLSERDARLAGDVSHLVARAMAKRREERYASAADFAEDVRRFLRHQPVAAHPGGTPYRLGRFVRRNRLAVAAGASIFLALAAGGGTSFALFRRAEAARAAEASQRAEAEAARDSAQREAAKSAATVDFLSQLLLEATPDRALGAQLTVRQALDRSAERLAAGSLAQQPEVEAAVRLTLGRAYSALGLEDLAGEQVLTAARMHAEGRLPGSEEAASVLRALASLKESRGEFPEARAATERCLALERALHRGAHRDVARALLIAGKIARESGDFRAGEAHFREALDMARALATSGGYSRDELGDVLNQLGILLVNVGSYREAEALFRESLALSTAEHGAEHPEVASVLHNLAWMLKEEERGAEARPLLARALAIRQRVLEPRHPRVAIQLTLHWAIAMDLGELDEAERLMNESLGILIEVYGAEHPQVTLNRNGEARLRLLQGRYAEARAIAQATVDLHRKRYGDSHWVTAGATSLMAQAMLGLGEHVAARDLLRKVVAIQEAQLGPRARGTRRARVALERAEAAVAQSSSP